MKIFENEDRQVLVYNILILALLFAIVQIFTISKTFMNLLVMFPLSIVTGLIFSIFLSILICLRYHHLNSKVFTYVVCARILNIFQNNYNISITYYNKALKLWKESKSKSFSPSLKKYYLYRIYEDIATCYYKLGDNELARKYFNKAVRFINKDKKQKYLDKITKKYFTEENTNYLQHINRVIGITIVIFFILGIFAEIYISEFSSTFFNNVATTYSLNDVYAIQEILLPKYNEIRVVNDGNLYQIQIIGKKRDYQKAVVDIASSKYFKYGIIFNYKDEMCVEINKHNQKTMRKYFAQIINNIDGVDNAKVKITLNKENLPVVEINIKNFEEKFDAEKAKQTIYNILNASILDLEPKNIKINIDVVKSSNDDMALAYYDKAVNGVDNNDTPTDILGNIQMAVKYSKDYQLALEQYERFIELNKLIKKYPNNYKLYIERADIQNVERIGILTSDIYIISDKYSAIFDYEKALELNPKAYQVYEKLAYAYEDTKMNEPALKYLLLAEKYSPNDNVYEKLGDKFIEQEPQKAVNYYNKISDKYKYLKSMDKTKIPYPDKNYVAIKHEPPYKIVQCYEKLHKYNKAIKYCDEILKNINNKDDIQFINNEKFHLNWKAKQYKQAIKDTSNCSYLICKIINKIN